MRHHAEISTTADCLYDTDRVGGGSSVSRSNGRGRGRGWGRGRGYSDCLLMQCAGTAAI